jgi:hypothetical protein
LAVVFGVLVEFTPLVGEVVVVVVPVAPMVSLVMAPVAPVLVVVVVVVLLVASLSRMLEQAVSARAQSATGINFRTFMSFSK